MHCVGVELPELFPVATTVGVGERSAQETGIQEAVLLISGEAGQHTVALGQVHVQHISAVRIVSSREVGRLHVPGRRIAVDGAYGRGRVGGAAVY